MEVVGVALALSLHKQVTPKCGSFQTFILQVHSRAGALERKQVGGCEVLGAQRTRRGGDSLDGPWGLHLP